MSKVITTNDEILKARNAFLADIFHQLKTPIGQMRGYIENMQDGVTGELLPKQKEYLDDMHITSLRSYRMVTNLLYHSRLERGIASPDPEEVSTNEIITLALDDYSGAIIKKGLNLNLNTDKNVVVYIDRDHAVDILSNFLQKSMVEIIKRRP